MGWGGRPRERECVKTLREDSPPALLPFNVLSALAFSRGPTAHGGERPTNITLTP